MATEPKDWVRESEDLYVHKSGARIARTEYRQKEGWYLMPVDLDDPVVEHPPTDEGLKLAFETFAKTGGRSAAKPKKKEVKKEKKREEPEEGEAREHDEERHEGVEAAEPAEVVKDKDDDEEDEDEEDEDEEKDAAEPA